MLFNAKKAAQDLREAFYVIKEHLNVSESLIDSRIQEDLVFEIQVRRLAELETLKKLKSELQVRFRDYRIEGRVKSLSSIFGKYLQDRKLMDVFGLKIVVATVDECYWMAEWIKRNYKVFEFKDKISNPKANGYRDLKLVIEFDNTYVEFIIQTAQMYVDANTLQAHPLVYPWKYHSAIQSLPVEYREVKF